MHYIIRDFYRHSFMQRKSRLEKIAAYLNDKYGAGTVAVELRDQYYNMKEKCRAGDADRGHCKKGDGGSRGNADRYSLSVEVPMAHSCPTRVCLPPTCLPAGLITTANSNVFRWSP